MSWPIRVTHFFGALLLVNTSAPVFNGNAGTVAWQAFGAPLNDADNAALTMYGRNAWSQGEQIADGAAHAQPAGAKAAGDTTVRPIPLEQPPPPNQPPPGCNTAPGAAELPAEVSEAIAAAAATLTATDTAPGAADLPADPGEWIAGDTLARIVNAAADLIGEGKAVYARESCAHCHGTPGAGDSTCLPLKGWVKAKGAMYNKSSGLAMVVRMKERSLANNDNLMNPDNLRSIERLQRAQQGPQRIAVWADIVLDNVLATKFKGIERNICMPTYAYLPQEDRTALLAYLMSEELK